MFWHATYEVARKEFLQLLRTKRLLGIGVAVVVAMVLFTIVLPAALGTGVLLDLFGSREAPAANALVGIFLQNPVFVFSGLFLLQLLALLLTGDAVASEWQERTLFLLLSKPVPRAAFVLGKFLGVAVSVGAFTALLMVLDYLLLVAIHGAPDAAGAGRFLVAVALVLLGMFAYAAAALLFSSLVRSPVAGTLLAIVAWVVIFPILGQLDLFVAIIRFGIDGVSPEHLGWSAFLSPGPAMRTGAGVLFTAPSESIASDAWEAAATLVAHVVVWSGLAVAVVQRRDFE